MKTVRLIPHGEQVHIRVSQERREDVRQVSKSLGISQAVVADDALAIGLKILAGQGVQ